METWVQPRMQAAIRIGGTLLGCLADTVSEDPISPAGGLVPAANGSTSYQTLAGEERPLSVRHEIQLDLATTSEGDYFILLGLLAQAAYVPLELWLDKPLVESWVIATSRTAWTMRRATAHDVVPIASYPPRAFVGTTELTRVASSPPAAGEFFVQPAAASTTLETADLSASAGQLLTLRYHPVRVLGSVEVGVQHADADVGLWSVTINAQEHLE